MPTNLISFFALVLTMLVCVPVQGVPLPHNDSESLLSRLDSLIANQENRVKEKEIRIKSLYEALAKTKKDSERLGLARQLYDEYLVFDSDSALHYAKLSGRISARLFPEDYDGITGWKLNEAFIYIVQGMHDTAITLLESIDPSRLGSEMKRSYFGSMSYLHSMRAVYMQSNHEMWEKDIAKANAYRDSIQAFGLPSAEEWEWVPVARALDSGSEGIRDVDISALKNIVDHSAGASRLNAINAYWLSRYYEATDDEENMLVYKTRAAIQDVLIVNREIAALQEIASYLFEKGDLNRAYNYLIYSVNQANMYHNRYRMVSLSDALPTVRDAYLNELAKRERKMSYLILVLGLTSLVFLASMIVIIIEFNKLKKMRNLLKATNEELSVSIMERDKAITALEKANKDLNEANTQKNSLIAYAFKLTAQSINAIEDYRKKLFRKYKINKIDDLGLLINDPELIKEHYKVFYEGFDKTVLSIFPDFIEEYNANVSPENRIPPESSTKLNTKLRIYALRRLGIAKSADIARMLNVSVRTVYNNKSSVQDGEEE